MNLLAKLICRWKGHRETRAGKRDLKNPKFIVPLRDMINSGRRLYVCRRCGAVRLAAARKAKGA